MHFRFVLLGLCFVFSATTAAEAAPPAPPVQMNSTGRFGIAVDDRYRPLENLASEETREWIASQATATRGHLASLPGRAALRARYDAIDAAQQPVLSVLRPAAGDRVFYVERLLGDATGRLYVREGRLPARALGDITMGPATRFSISPDGQRILLSQAGVAASTVTVADVARGSVSTTLVSDAWNGAEPKWRPDGAGFYYVAATPADAATGVVHFELMTYLFAQGIVRPISAWRRAMTAGDSATIMPSTDGGTLFLATRNRVSECLQVAFVSLNADGEAGPWTPLIDEDDEVRAFVIYGTVAYGRTMKSTTLGRIVRYDAMQAGRPPVTALMGSGDDVLQDMAAASDGLYVTSRHGSTMSLVRVSYGNAAAPVNIALPFEGSLKFLATDPDRAGALFALEGWTRPAEYLRAEGDRVSSLTLQKYSTTIGRDWVAEALTCAARDGTPIPMTVVHRNDIRLDGSHPLILNGYGGYGFVEPAYFYPKSEPWIERDGIFADVLPRGSGATGEAWHRAGMGASKANTWTDLEACADTLIERGYTSPDRLIIQGTAIGALMVGRAMTERPGLFAAVVMRWGITDALRFIESPAHRPADEIELGRADSASGVTQLLEDSVDAHIRDGVRYPAVFMTTGLKDSRFPAWMQLKTAARLEAVSVTDRRPVLLRVDPDGGAGLPMTPAQRNDELADRISFMLWIVGDKAFQPEH